MASHLMPTYKRSELAFERGEGSYLFTADGRRYLDFAAGIAVNALGHCHPHVVAALERQGRKLWHTSNLYRIPEGERLADRLCEHSFADKVFFTNSGVEAIECGIKLIRKYHDDTGNPGKWRIIGCTGAFHGRTLTALAAAGNPKYLEGFAPEVPGFVHVAFGNMNELRAAITDETAAIIVEPIQGEGGIRAADVEYLRQLRRVCDEYGLLLYFDEVQCGMGRTGKWFAHQWAGIRPDVMPLAKGLGSGVPVGAVVCGPRAADVFGPGNHGTTFGGNPLAMRAGVETIRIMEEDRLLAHVDAVGSVLKAGLARALAGVKGVVEIRGQGLMLGIELDRPCGALLGQAAQAGLLISVTADRVIRLVPPLILSADEAAQIVAILCPLIRAFLAEAQP